MLRQKSLIEFVPQQREETVAAQASSEHLVPGTHRPGGQGTAAGSSCFVQQAGAPTQ